MKLRRALPLLSAVGLLALEARGDAPPKQYEAFNKANLTITDPNTELVWERYPSAPVADLGQAAAYCAKLTLGSLSTFRLPTVKELLTLVDEVPHGEFDGARAIDRNAFPATDITHPFISQGNDGQHLWVVYFETGTALTLPNNTPGPFAVRCVYAKP